MIRKELYDKERKLYRTYSDEDYRIRQVETGIVFDDAVDTEDATFTYEETDEKIIRLEELDEEEGEYNGIQ